VSRRLRGFIVVARRQRTVSVMVKMHRSASPISAGTPGKAFQSVLLRKTWGVTCKYYARILFWIA